MPGSAAAELFVAPSGADANDGTTPAVAVRSLQRALDLALPGVVIHLAPGVYDAAETRRPGTAQAPITIAGTETGTNPAGRFTTIIRGGKIVLQINHSYYHLNGVTVDGQPAVDRRRFPSALDAARPFKTSIAAEVANSKLIYIGYAPSSRNITGVVLDNVFLHGAGGECVRLRNNAFGNIVQHTVIEWCGLAPSGDDESRDRFHNGEGVYIGTSPKSTTQPMFAHDTSHDNIVRDSLISTFGTECFQTKENAHHNVMQRVTCRNNDEPLRFSGSNVELRGDHNVVEDSSLSGSRGVNLKIATDGPEFDRGGNSIVRTTFSEAAGAHLSIKTRLPLGLVCGNTFSTSRIVDGSTSLADAAKPCPSK